MSARERKERDREARERLIVSAARELAETDGWDAVTTRRLAERIEYSQPVLYSHFSGKDEIVGAVALVGCLELTEAVRRAVPAEAHPRAAVRALAGAYVDYAERHPAVYDAMFSLNTGLTFATEETPEPLRMAFAALLDTLQRVAGTADAGTFTEVGWAALHGIVTLTRAGRLPAERTAERLEILTDRLTSAIAPAVPAADQDC
jgi:AcrR family transcriptional regulator